MANIPIRDIPGAVVASPDPSNIIPMDNGALMQKTTIGNAVNTALPMASQSEAEAGVDNVKRMSPLRTKQAIDAQTPAIVNSAITSLNLGTMSQEESSDYTPTSGLAAVALSNDYNDLDNLPTLGSAAATDASDYATAAQGALADTAVQPSNSALVPAGGTIGQVLVKNSGTNYDTGWVSSAAATAVSYAPQTLTTPQQAQARDNIALGNSATRNVGTTTGTVAAGDDSRIVGAVQMAGDAGIGGYTSGSENLGNMSGTITLTVGVGAENFKNGVNVGAMTINAPTTPGCYTIILEIVNGSSAGAVTLSGFDNTNDLGAAFSTTNGKKFIVRIEKTNSLKTAYVSAMP